MSLKSSFMFLVLIFINTVRIQAQQALLSHYTVLDGLPSNTIYDIYQDSKGYIWFCTDQGISRFDGTEFKNYSTSQGLPDTEVFRIREDDQQRCWLVCYNFKACYVLHDKIYNSSNDTLCRRIEEEQIRYENMFRDINGDWCLSGRKIGILKGNQLLMKLTRDTALETEISSYFKHEGKEYLINTTNIYQLANGLRQRISSYSMGPVLYDRGHLILFRSEAKNFMIEDWVFVKGLFRMQRRTPVPSRIYQFTLLPDGNIFCCSESGTLKYDIQTAKLSEDRILPRDVYATRTIMDREGNRWLGTVTDGVYIKSGAPPSIIDRQSGLSSNNILSLKAIPDGTLLAGDGTGNINLIKENNRIQNFSVVRKGFRNRIVFAYPLNNEQLIAGGDMGVFIINCKKHTAEPVFDHVLSCKTGVFKRKYCLLGFPHGAERYDNATGRLEKLWKQRTTAIEEDPSGIIWFGALDGLYYYKQNKVYKYNRSPILSQSRITTLAITPEGYVAAGTSTNGLFIIPGINIPPRQLSQYNGLSGNNCKKVLAEAKQYLWCCSENGLDRISSSPGGQFTIYAYPLPAGLSGSSINDIAVIKGQIYLATPDGIIILNNQDSITRTPLLYFQSVNNTAYSETTGPPLVLPYNRNSLQVTYTGISFTGGRNVNYKYFLNGGNTDTTHTNARVINFSALKPGDYELLVWARISEGPWTKEPVSLRFRVLPPWWLAPWVIILAAASVISLIVLIYRYRIKHILIKTEKAARNRQQIAELELRALRAQINPHFLFNALNSIQTYYSLNDELKANHYMSSFARFIRKTLAYSQTHWLTIQEEITMLQTYIELEQMRFKQLFTYTITLSPQIRPEAVMIPAMLIQPYVENAINHGLRHLKDRQGVLSLRFELEGKQLYCIVEDNGIGRRESGKYRSRTHQSFGMSINRQRIDTINQLYQTGISISITDKQLDDTYTGTIIKIHIPLKDELTYIDRNTD